MFLIKKKRVISAWLLAVISIFPVLFIVWLSLLNADDINYSLFFPQKRNNKVTFFVPTKDSVDIAATSLGQIYLLKKNKNEKPVDINSIATVYTKSGSSLWAFSANKGLIEIDLENRKEKVSYDWNFFKKNYENFNSTRFYVSEEVLPEHFEWLANKLNFEPSVPGASKDTTIASIIRESYGNFYFFSSEEMIGQLNWVLTNDKILNSIIKHWKKWDGWLNPQIHDLFKIMYPTEKEKDLIFRFCLSELFPNVISRFKHFSWQDIWVNQIANSGLSILSVNDKIIMSIRDDFFPGIAIFDTRTKQLTWITESMGLPSTSIQNIIQISEHEILVIHNLGLSIIQFESEKITHNIMFGEYGLPHLDEQNLFIKNLPDYKILISYNSGSMIFDLNEFKTEPAQEQVPMSQLISSYYEDNKGNKWIGYNYGKIEVLNNANVKIKEANIPKASRVLQWRNYQDIIRIMSLPLFLKNSAIISISISIICTLLSILPSYAIARLNFFGKTVVSRVVLSSQLLSSLPFIIPIFVIFIILQMNSFEMFNNFITIIIVNIAFFLPLTIQFMFNIFKAIPANIEESAMMDGCSIWQTFYKIILPNILPAISTCFVYVFLFAWDEIMFIWILSTDANTATLPVGIRLTVGQLVSHPELLMAFSVIASIPPILLFALTQNFLLKSLTRK